MEWERRVNHRISYLFLEKVKLEEKKRSNENKKREEDEERG